MALRFDATRFGVMTINSEEWRVSQLYLLASHLSDSTCSRLFLPLDSDISPVYLLRTIDWGKEKGE